MMNIKDFKQFSQNTREKSPSEDDSDDSGSESGGGTQLQGSLFLIPPELRHGLLQKLKEKLLAAFKRVFGNNKTGPRRPDIDRSKLAATKGLRQSAFKSHPLLSNMPAGIIDASLLPTIPDNPEALEQAVQRADQLEPQLQKRLQYQLGLQLGRRAKPTVALPELKRT